MEMPVSAEQAAESKHRRQYRGRDFRQQQLAGADFQGLDIRGANFSGANLAEADFRGARAGIPNFWFMGLIGLNWAIAFLAGLTSGYGSAFFADLATAGHWEQMLFCAVTILTLAGYSTIVILRGIGALLAIYSEVAIASLIIAIAFFPEYETGKPLIEGALFSLLALVGTLSGMIHWAITINLSKSLHLPKLQFILLPTAATGLLLGILFGIRGPEIGYGVAAAVGIANLLLGNFAGKSAFRRDSRYRLVSRLCLRLISLKGTRFCQANLKDALFSEAILYSADFREANLTRADWFQAKALAQARLDNTYLANEKIRQLVVSREGSGGCFDGLDLQGINLKGANLQGASFIGANLSDANLEEADLAGAKLAQTQLYGARLQGASLTGSYIQNWGIASTTQFSGVTCDYVYMQLPTAADPDPCRKPDNRQEIFRPGDFEIFMAPIIKTLDLYQQQNVDPRRVATTYKTIDLFHHEGIDPGAAAIALKQLAQDYPEAGLEIVALEGRKDEKIRMQARVSSQSDRSALSAAYFEKYQQATALPYADLQALLAAIAEKDERIQSLENMVNAAIQSDKFYVETYYALGQAKGEQAEGEQAPPARILILTANPQRSDQRRLEAEVREIQAGLERAKQRDRFEIVPKWAVRTEDLRRALLDYSPQIVQFSGYGTSEAGLLFEDERGQVKPVSTEALAKLFELFKDRVSCVFLNACYSETQAEAISAHIPYVIGMSRDVGDRAALTFTVAFYDAIGAGQPTPAAFKLGCVALELEGIPESLAPVLKTHRSQPPAQD